MILTFIVLYQMLETETQERAQKTKIFKALGMEDSFIAKVRRIEIMLMIFFAAAGSAVAIGCYYMIKFKM